MSRSVRAVPVVLLAFALAGCTAGVASTTSTTKTTLTDLSSGVVAAGEGGPDQGFVLGGRPQVTNDGLMVRRRVVIAIYPVPGADLVSLRKQLDAAAARAHTSLSSFPPAVLEPALLEPVGPEMTLALPAGKTLAAARRLMDPASKGRAIPGVQRYDVASVLVHDLQFKVSSANPAVLAEAIAREGIVSDALGFYTTTFGDYELDITYTGPLLSDELVESVRAGIARRAHTQPEAVDISPLSTTGIGVDLAKERAPAPVVAEASTTHHHTALRAVTASSSSPQWGLGAVSIAALAALGLLILTLALLQSRRANRPDES